MLNKISNRSLAYTVLLISNRLFVSRDKSPVAHKLQRLLTLICEGVIQGLTLPKRGMKSRQGAYVRGIMIRR